MKTMKCAALVCLLLLSIFSRAEELNPVLRQYSVNNGLSDNYVTAICQDREGFVWIGTNSGINRFDGYEFKTYSQFANRSVVSLLTDVSNNLFAVVDNELFAYQPGADSFAPCFGETNPQSIQISAASFDRDGCLWALDRKGVMYRFDEKLQLVNTFASLNGSRFIDFSLDTDNHCWASDLTGHLTRIDHQTGAQQSFTLFGKDENPLSKKLYRVVPSKHYNRIYVAYEKDDVMVFLPDTGEHYHLDIQGHYHKPLLVNDIIETDKDIIWIATNDGIIIHNLESKEWSEMHYQSTNIHSLQSQIITRLYKDKESNIWIGSPQNGISYYAKSLFNVYYPTPTVGSLQGEIIRDIVEDSGRIWLSTEDKGIAIYEKDQKRFTNFASTTNADIRGLSISQGKVWVSHLIHGIESYDMSGRKLKSYSLDWEGNTRNTHINTSLTLSDGTLLVGTSGGLFRYDTATDSFIRVSDIASNSYYTIRENKQNNLLLYAGYACPLNDALQGNFHFQPMDLPESAQSDRVIDLATDSEGNVWYLTNRSGVFRKDKETQRLTQFSIGRQTSSTQLQRILADDYGRVWVSSVSGLFSIDIHNGTTECYTEADGLQTSQFNNYAAYKDADGTLYFGTTRGLVVFDPRQIAPRPQKEHIVITSVSYYDQRTRQTELKNPLVQDLTFKDWQNTIRIGLSTLTYQQLGGLQFEYQMGNGNWNKTIANQIVLNNLSPGSYKMSIQVVDLDGTILSAEPLCFTLTVLPPWWQSRPAYLVYLLAVILLSFVLARSYAKWQKRKMEHEVLRFESEKEKELYETKIDFFTNIAHEIRTPVTLIKDPLDRLLKKSAATESDKQALEVMEKNANRLLDLVNQLLDFKSKDKGKNLIFVKTEIVSFLKDIIDTCSFAVEKKQMVLNKTFDLPELYADIDKEGFRKIVFNLLTNAVKYGEHMVSVHIYQDKEQKNFLIDFINDGTPIPTSDHAKIFEPLYRSAATQHIQGTGLGLSITSFLVNLHHGSLTLVQSNEEATIFRISLPVRQEASFIMKRQEQTEEPQPAGPETAMEPVADDSITILVVEDDKDMNRYICSLLKDKYKVVTVENGQEAIDVLTEQTINLVVSDVVMPKLDGYGLLLELKTNLSFSHIPIILLTSQASVEDRLKGLESGADAYIDKPFSTEILLAQISNLLQNRESIRQFYFKSPIANMKSMAFSKTDEQFLEKLNNIINEHLSDEELNVNTLAEHLNMSRATLYRKIKSISKTSPNELITITRLKKAAELLTSSDMKVYEVSDAVGFSSQSYFWTAFTKHFGISPSKYAQK